MNRSEYQGFIIEARSHQLSDDGRWTLNVDIERHYGDGVATSPYSAATTFETEAEAVQHCINFGRQIIDGRVPGCVAP